MTEASDPRPALGLRRVINAAGTMTALGSSAAVGEARQAADALLPWFVEIDDLQRLASRTIAASTGAEAGFVTASASAGITLCIAGAMSGPDIGRIRQLPDPTGMCPDVLIQDGHRVYYGAPLEQAIRLAGARIVPVAQGPGAADRLRSALGAKTAAALYVVSHHVDQSGQIPLADFADICRARGVPVIVDAASEYDLTGFIGAGADLVITSAHKFLGGLTAGIVAGRKKLVRAAYLQNLGIGRGMKVGKEGIVGAIAALQAWSRRDHDGERRREQAHVALWLERLGDLPGIRLALSPDPTGNPITRLRVVVTEGSGTTAWDLADALALGTRPVIVRDDEVAQGYFELDPCNLREGEAEEVADRIVLELKEARDGRAKVTSLAEWRNSRLTARLAWPDAPSSGSPEIR